MASSRQSLEQDNSEWARREDSIVMSGQGQR